MLWRVCSFLQCLPQCSQHRPCCARLRRSGPPAESIRAFRTHRWALSATVGASPSISGRSPAVRGWRARLGRRALRNMALLLPCKGICCACELLGSMPSFVALRLWVGQRSLQRRRLDGNSTIFQLQNCGNKPHNAQYHQRTWSKNQHTCMEYRGCGPSMIQAAPTLLQSRVGHVDATNADDQVFTKRSQDLNDSRQKQSRKPVQTTLSAM